MIGRSLSLDDTLGAAHRFNARGIDMRPSNSVAAARDCTRSTRFSRAWLSRDRMAGLFKTPQYLGAPPLTFPSAGPNAAPQLVEIDVTPWQRICVTYRPAQAMKSEESGSVWYWRPDTVTSLAA